MDFIYADNALTSQGWQTRVRLGLEQGRIATLQTGVEAGADDERHAIVLPGMPNLHSHAFQRGMAGLAEVRGPGADSFWSWRDLMYRFALSMTPDQLQAVAAQLYVEMLEAGYTRVAEFHYLHHDPQGKPYADIAEMAGRIGAAAAHSGIGLTLLPVFYAHAGFGGQAANPQQRRFVNSVDSYARLHEGAGQALRALEGAVVGVAPHSLRAVTPQQLQAVTALAGSNPIHIHIAEQQKEVDDCISWSGARPVQWLLDHAAVDARWCLVHATHTTPQELVAMAGSQAVAGLCLVTEANLGDGIFDAPSFVEAGGRYGIGTDSNVQIGVAEELRLLEYSQRLARQARNVMARAGSETGQSLFEAALAGGSQALGVAAVNGVYGLAPGASADLVSLNARHLALDGCRPEQVLSAWIFTGHSLVDCVWAGGRKQVAGGRHLQREAIEQRFRTAMKALRA